MKALHQPCAFFDVDHTLIDVNSGRSWLEREWRLGRLGIFDGVRAMSWLMRYRLGWLDFAACAEYSLQRFRDRLASEIHDELASWAISEIAPRICTQARSAIEAHRQQGHMIALLTSGPSFTARALADHLEIEHLLCTEVEVRDGRVTGKTVAPVCYGPGKVELAERFAQRHQVCLRSSYFYSDSSSDTPMLDRVGFARVINPDPRLRITALRRGWPVERWSSAPAQIAS